MVGLQPAEKGTVMDNSTKKLLNGSVVYFVGTALSQLASLLLMRFVTGHISPEEYGFFNLLTTVSNLVIPFVTLQIADAAFKFVLKSQTEDEKKSYLTTCFVVALGSVTLIAVGVPILSCFFTIPQKGLVVLYVASYAVSGIYQKVLRCLNQSKVLVTGSLMKTILFLLLEILLISVLDMRLEALLLANSLSTVFFLIYAEWRVRSIKFLELRPRRLRVLPSMLRFSVPLMPNAAFWWLTSSVNNVIVSAKLGVDVNGIYAVSGKFSGVLALVTGVLNMSWQDTAVADYGNDGFSTFLTKTLNTYIKLIFSAVAVLVPLIAVVLPYMIAPTYYAAIPYAPFLLFASGLSAISSFLAQIFTGQGKTKTIMTTSLFGMLANVAVIAVLVESLGLWAAVAGSLAADSVLVAVRAFMARKEFDKGVEYVSFAVVLGMLAVSVYLYLTQGALVNVIWLVCAVALAVVLNWSFIKDLFTIVFGRFAKPKKGDEAVS
ncbi:MAG: lipopolysaccharide biosynthesis protein [Clostridia bacterium]|nr:lipopolysaccharide biosynthesis protein [Clostridia bacterium]